MCCISSQSLKSHELLSLVTVFHSTVPCYLLFAEKMYFLDLQHTEGQLQMEEFPLPDFQATYLRFIIKSAFDHFVSVHRVMAEGTAEDT